MKSPLKADTYSDYSTRLLLRALGADTESAETLQDFRRLLDVCGDPAEDVSKDQATFLKALQLGCPGVAGKEPL